MNNTVVKLPEAEEMLDRLLEVDNTSHLEEGFYPLLIQHAGEEKVPIGVVNMIVLAIHDYSIDQAPIISGLLLMNMEAYLRAMIDDEDALEKAISFYKEATTKG